MTESMQNFRRYVDDSANLLALDLAALLNRAYSLGVAICPDVDPDEGSSYSIEWAFGVSRHVDVEWDAGRKRWAVIGGVVEGMPQTRPAVP
jgi:hypothetical protein